MINNKLLNKTSICILVLIIVILVIVLFYNYFNRHKTSKEKFNTEPSINGKTDKITCQNCNSIPNSNGSDVNLFAVFIYDDNGRILNLFTNGTAALSTIYQFNAQSLGPTNA
jgi:uncharacterized protein YneF (UPF0154 family)